MHARKTTILLILAAATAMSAGCSSKKKKDEETTGNTAPGAVSFPGPGGATFNNLLSGITPATGSTRGGTVVTLTGQQFYGTPIVEFAGFNATEVAVVSSTELTCKTPAHSEGYKDVILYLENGQSGRLNNAFFYDPNIGPPARIADYGDPSPEEQELLELFNRARRNPTAEGQRLGIDFSQYPAIFPLSHNGLLAAAAGGHSEDMAARAFYDHINPDGDNANGRILDQNYDLHASYGTNRTVNLTENIGVGQGNRFNTPQDVHDTFMKEEGSASLKHRLNILGVGQFATNREVGTGFRTNLPSTSIWEHYGTFEFARTKSDSPFIVGTVYNDTNPDGLCRVGEGRAGVTVTLEDANGFKLTTTTKTAGGYAFEIFVPGTWTVTIDGVATTVQIDATNVKVDLRNQEIMKFN